MPHYKWALLHFSMARPQVAVGGDGLQTWTVDADMSILSKESRTADKGRSSSFGVRHRVNST